MTIWLRPNTRALCMGMILPGALVATNIVLLYAVEHSAVRIAAGFLAALGGALTLFLAWLVTLPRLAYDHGQLLVYLHGFRPIRVPIEIVECFLLGQAPTMLPGKRHEHAETASVVIRLSETAADWARREVKPALGKWCDGYITLRGTWCEPLDVTVINRLNGQLADVHQSIR